MRQLQLLVKPASGFCNMRCQYCFYRDEQENRACPDSGMMSLSTAETLIRQCFAELNPGGSLSLAFQGGEPTLAGLDFFRFFTQTVRKYNQKHVRVQYAIQTNGLAITEDWAAFFREEGFLIGVSLDGIPSVHDALRLDAGGGGTWERVSQALTLLNQYQVPCNLLCVVTKRLAKKAAGAYRTMKETGIRYFQFIACLDPLNVPRGKEDYSLSSELYGQFLCCLFDEWYRDWKSGSYVSIRLFEDYIHLLIGSPASTCSTTGACGAYLVVEGGGAVYPCDFFCLDSYRLGTVREDSFRAMLSGETMRVFLTDGWKTPAACRSCEWVRLCRGGCKRDRIVADNSNYYCKAFQRFFPYALPRMYEIAQALRLRR